MKHTVSLAKEFPKGLVERLAAYYDVIRIDIARPDSFSAEAREASVLVTLGSFASGPALMDALPKLRLIVTYGTGFEGVDLEAARARGIQVANGGESNADAVAEFAVGLLLALSRDMVLGDRSLRRGEWRDQIMGRMRLSPGVAGQRVGIYGLGTIGRKIARLLEPFRVEIAYHNRRPRADVSYAYHDSLLALATWADVLMVAVRADKSNTHAVNADVLRALGPGGRLVNVSRGIAVDEVALCDALEQRLIAGAALDVFEVEPNIPDRLLARDDVILTPHMAAICGNAQRAQFETLKANLTAHFAGRPPVTLVQG